MKLILLDRDGVINYDSKDYIKSPQEWRPLPGSLEAIARLNQAGYYVAVASNQSGLGRHYFDVATLEAIHEKMQKTLAAVGGKLDALFFCPHHPDANCLCRKPKPGLLEQALKYFKLEANEACFIGDSLRDLEAAQALAMPSALVLTGNGQKTLDNNPTLSVPCFKNLADFSQQLLTTTNRNLL